MNDAKRAFLQSFMAAGCLNSMEVRQLFKDCCSQHGEHLSANRRERMSHMVEFIRTINENIIPFQLEMKKAISEEDGDHFYCLVCSAENEIARLSSCYTAVQLEFYKKLVEIIVENDGCVGSRVALGITDIIGGKMTKTDAESLLHWMESDRWIVQKNGQVSLSVRSVTEMSHYIRETFPDCVRDCDICKLMCLQGVSCSACRVKMHRHCAERYFLSVQPPVCPSEGCDAEWKLFP